MGRLIDADAFKNVNLETLLCFNGTPYVKVSEMFQLINNQPTAYDKEKVVADLEEAKGEIALNEDDLNIYCGALDDAIDIVRKGGVE